MNKETKLKNEPCLSIPEAFIIDELNRLEVDEESELLKLPLIKPSNDEPVPKQKNNKQVIIIDF